MATPIVSISHACALTLSLSVPVATFAGEPGSSLVKGPDVQLFGETVTSEYALDAAARLQSIQFTVPFAAIEKATQHHSASLTFDMPDSLEKDSLVKHITIDWNSHGHEPDNVYDRPHFDFHFYFTAKDKVDAIDCSDRTPIPDELIPSGYVLPPLDAPTACVPGMGVHAVPMKDLEEGFVFAATPIYGFYEGKMIFFEPMVTHDHLLAGRPVAQKLEYPGAFLVNVTNHFIPTDFQITFDAPSQTYRITLSMLKDSPDQEPASL
jgi:hypothetical protein